MNYYLWPKFLLGRSISKLHGNMHKEGWGYPVRKPPGVQLRTAALWMSPGPSTLLLFLVVHSGVRIWRLIFWRLRVSLWKRGRARRNLLFESAPLRAQVKVLRVTSFPSSEPPRAEGLCCLLSTRNPWHMVWGERVCHLKAHCILLVMSPELGKPSSFCCHFKCEKWQERVSQTWHLRGICHTLLRTPPPPSVSSFTCPSQDWKQPGAAQIPEARWAEKLMGTLSRKPPPPEIQTRVSFGDVSPHRLTVT